MAIQEANRNKLGMTCHRTALATAGAQTGWWPQVGRRNRSLLVVQTAVRHQNRLGNRAKLAQKCPVGVDIKAIGCAKRWLRIGWAAPDIDARAVRIVLPLLDVRIQKRLAVLRGIVAEQALIVVLRIHQVGNRDLLDIRHTRDATGLLTGLGKDREEDGGKNRDDRDNDEELDERKC